MGDFLKLFTFIIIIQVKIIIITINKYGKGRCTERPSFFFKFETRISVVLDKAANFTMVLVMEDTYSVWYLQGYIGILCQRDKRDDL